MFATSIEIFTQDEVRVLKKMLKGVKYSPVQKKRMENGNYEELLKNSLEVSAKDEQALQAINFIRDGLFASNIFKSFALPKRLTILLNCYKKGMFYKQHIDSSLMQNPDGQFVRSDLSFTLFLSEPSEYEGGELEISFPFGNKIIKEKAGSLVLYSAETLHEVNCVRKGIRWSAVGWVESFVQDPIKRQIQNDLTMLMLDLNEKIDSPTKRQFENIRERLLRLWINNS